MPLLPPLPITETELSAYADGEAAPERIPVIEACLARDPAQAAKVRAWRRHNQVLRTMMGRLPCEAPPDALVRAARPQVDAGAKVTPLFPATPRSAPRRASWDRRDLMALVTAGSFLAGAGVACLAGYMLG